jgi:hypothetical protein
MVAVCHRPPSMGHSQGYCGTKPASLSGPLERARYNSGRAGYGMRLPLRDDGLRAQTATGIGGNGSSLPDKHARGKVVSSGDHPRCNPVVGDNQQLRPEVTGVGLATSTGELLERL